MSDETGGSSKKKKKVEVTVNNEDDEAIHSHLSELDKELKRSRFDEGKVARLLSLTFASRRKLMLDLTANVRVSSALRKYPCFKRPLFVS